MVSQERLVVIIPLALLASLVIYKSQYKVIKNVANIVVSNPRDNPVADAAQAKTPARTSKTDLSIYAVDSSRQTHQINNSQLANFRRTSAWERTAITTTAVETTTSPKTIASIDKTGRFECRHCDVWGKGKRNQSWSHTELIRKMYVDAVKTGVTGYTIQAGGVTPGVFQKPMPFNDSKRFGGLDWPMFGYAMTDEWCTGACQCTTFPPGAPKKLKPPIISCMMRLNQLEDALETAIREGVQGDVIECGVWRGGTSIVARAIIVSLNSDKITYVADSFQGLPRSSTVMDNDNFHAMSYLRVSVDNVLHHFERFHLYDKEKVIFLRGFFNETMPVARSTIKKLCILRLDGDMYESCFDVINQLYDRLSVGGYLIVDDWNGFACKNAVMEFRAAVGIREPIKPIDRLAVFWRKTTDHAYDHNELTEKLLMPKKRKKG